MLRLYAYKPGSKSGKALSQALGIKRIKHENSKFVPRKGRIILNWGATQMPQKFIGADIINHPDDVARVSNKLKFFESMEEYEDVNTVPYTSKQDEAKAWLEEEKAVVCRTILNGNSGNGIVVADTKDELVAAKLYTQYVKKKDEYRVHVYDGKVFDVQRKAKREDVEDVNWRIRNHDNGFIFKRNDIDPPQSVLNQAIAAVEASGLTFGAVDIIWNEKKEEAYVLEINTAPGLEGSTLENYVEIFQKFL